MEQDKYDQTKDSHPLHDNKVVVVYTGPTGTNTSGGKNWMYLRNFEYFLQHGIDCLAHDTVLILTEEVANYYYSTVDKVKYRCDTLRGQMNFVLTEASSSSGRSSRTNENMYGTVTSNRPSVRVLQREDKCYDMEGFRVALEQVDVSLYDYWVYLNCGVVGPKIPSTAVSVATASSIRNDAFAPHHPNTPWVHRYIALLSDNVKMAGVSINCQISPHVQSMLFAVDKVGLEIIQKSGVVHDCGIPNAEMSRDARLAIIERYEIGMSRAILQAGYNIRSTHGLYGPMEIRPRDLQRTEQLQGWCSDLWKLNIFPLDPNTTWSDWMFFKSSRGFLLPDMVEELKYAQKDYFQILELPVHEVVNQFPIRDDDKRDPAQIALDKEFGYLWAGDAPSNNKKNAKLNPRLSKVSIVISYCRGNLSWLKSFLSGVYFTSITVVSKCGDHPPSKYLPPGTGHMTLPNVGRVDHTMAYWMSHIMPRQSTKKDDILIFLKDNLFQQPPERRRNMKQLVNIAVSNGFACLQIPHAGMSQFHSTEALGYFNMTFYDGAPLYREDGSRIIKGSNEFFKSKFENMRDWLTSLGIASMSSAGFAPVCYGGAYAVRASQVQDVPLKLLQKLERSLSRSDNIEEGHFAERLWASLFSPTLTENQTQYLLQRGKHVNWHGQPDGGGYIGILEEWVHFGPPQRSPSVKVEKSSWRQNKTTGRWMWPEHYQAKIIDSDNICIRPIVEPNIPSSTNNTAHEKVVYHRPDTVAMCSITKRNNVRYINEWLDYHVAIGVAHFYLYDVHSAPHLKRVLNATRTNWWDYISVKHWPGGDGERTAIWTHCAKMAQSSPKQAPKLGVAETRVREPSHTWLANMDADEFLVLWQHNHIVSLLQEEKLSSGSVHMASYTFAPDPATSDDLKRLNLLSSSSASSESKVYLNEYQTYKASATLSPNGVPRPLLHRNRACGELGWDGDWRALFHLKVKTIVKTKDVIGFDPVSSLPILIPGRHRKTMRGDILNTTWASSSSIGADIAALFRFPFKSVLEFIHQECHEGYKSSGDGGVGSSRRLTNNTLSSTSSGVFVDNEQCLAALEFAVDPKAWSPYRYNMDHTAWATLIQRIPWYKHFDEAPAQLVGEEDQSYVDCQKHHPSLRSPPFLVD